MNTRHLSRGFTLIELLMVMVLVAILATLAAPSFTAATHNQALSSVSSDLYSSLLQARSEALKANRIVRIAPVADNDWAKGWQVYIDSDRDGAFTSGTDTMVISRAATQTL
jgi:type IV fimbrial biogenesis protein FimT